ncbi:MAG TPA: glycosyltransferase [Thermoplasmata archaeon]|nr:glycosyltransferase [Thermoplasmata archaeon]
MAGRTVDLLAAGPAPVDPYEPAAAAWALAEGLRDRRCSVRVLFPTGPGGGAPPPGVETASIEIPIRRPGAAVEPADFARAAARRIRPDAELVLRDPSGLGPLALSHRGGGHRIDAIVRAVHLGEFDRERASRRPNGLMDRVDTWRDRRAVRRLEKEALDEADAIFCDSPVVADEIVAAYRIPRDGIRPTIPPVALGPPPPSRDEARAELGLPTDVPVVAALAASENAEEAGIDRVREAFRRIRPLFPGVRLVVAGAEAPVEPGVHAAPERDRAVFVRALAAADVAVFARRLVGFDPGLVLALRQGVASVALATARLPTEPNGAVRTVPGDDPGDLSSAVAELVADLAQRRALAAQGPAYASRFLPERVAAELLGEPAAARV